LRDILKIKELSYGEFPEISDLNPRFKPGSRKVKMVLDIQLPTVSGEMGLYMILLKLMKLLPTLEKHQCGEHLFEDLKLDTKTTELSHSEKITHIAHLMEHVIIDLQAKVTGMDSCSGITCGYKNPDNRFDLFVECKDKKVGLFSAFFAVDLFGNLLTRKNLSKTYPALIDLARYLYRNKLLQEWIGFDPMVSRISSELGWKKSFVLSLLRKLKEFGLFNHKHALAN
jgi:hypothetical protein